MRKYPWVFRLLKWLVNIAATAWVSLAALFNFALILSYPTKDKAMPIIWHEVLELIPLYTAFILLLLLINFLYERKVERRAESKEYLLLFLLQSIWLVSLIMYFSWDFYQRCYDVAT